MQQSIGNYFGAYSPGHYLKQFLPKYSSEADVNRMAKEQGFDNWGRMLLLQEGLGAQSGGAHARPVAHDQADQHADLDDGAQPVLLRGGHRGQPASLHRQRRA